MTSKKSLKKDSGSQTAEEISAEYAARKADLEALQRETAFTLETALEGANIKIHGVEGRVKTLQSLLIKSEEKQLSRPMKDLVDIVGIRAVCLFRSDMSRVHDVIIDSFIVETVDDKVHDSVDTFGYMSTHYVCRLKDEYVGPRYDQLKGMRFEIQSRTLCMHAWAAISHYLSYKGQWDVPADNRKAINALSGLFYIADNEFERAYQDREQSIEVSQIEVQSGQLADTDINLDTVSVYLNSKYPSRRNLTGGYSDFVQALVDSGYKNIDEIDRDIDRASRAFLRYESDHPPTNSKSYGDLGAARLSLGIASEPFFRESTGKISARLPDYRKYLDE